MRFERLHFLRYGNLTDVTFRFRADARLHLVYGPNEAGKSSALAALSDLLFGFSNKRKTADGEDVNRYDFLHPGPSLRVAATLRNRAGETIAFRRRRGNKNTLLADEDAETPLRDDALAPFLGSLTQDVFERSFGLNSQRLQDGARAMISGEGGEDGLLLAAASGLGGLRDLRATLASEADRIFTPRAAKERLFYQALAAYDEARVDERDHRLRASDWKAINEAIAASEAEVDEARTALTELRKRQARLQQLDQFDKLLAEVREHERTLGDFADLDAVATGFGRSLRDRLDARDRARTAHRAATEALQDAERARDGIAPDRALLAKADAVTGLFAQTGAYRERRKDIPRVQAQVDEQTQDLAALLRRLGLGALPTDSESLGARQPSDATLATVGDGIERGRLLLARRDQLAQDIADQRSALAKFAGAPGQDAPSDPAPLAARFDALAPDIRALEALPDLEERHRTAARRAREAGARLSPPVADVAALADVALPSVETLSDHRTRLAALEDALRRHDEGARRQAEELARLDAQIAETERAGDVPTPAAIAEARDLRDAALTSLLAQAPGASDEERSAAVERHRTLVLEADRLADRAASEADRVSRHADMSQRRAALVADRTSGAAERERMLADYREARASYLGLFRAAGVEPLAPGEMIVWRHGIEAARDDLERANVLADEIAGLHDNARSIRTPLEAIARELEIADPGAMPLEALVRLVEQAFAAREKAWGEGRMLAARRQDAQERLTDLERRAAENLDALTAWRGTFDADLQGIGLPPGTGLEAAAAAVSLWRELPEKLKARDADARRVHGMRRDNAAFDAALASLIGEIAPDLADHAPDAAADELHKRLEAAQASETRRDSAETQARDARARSTACAEALQAADSALAELLSHLPQTLRDGDLAALAMRLDRRDAEREALETALGRFAHMARGESRAEVEAELAGFDAEATSVDLDVLEREETAQTETLNAAFHALEAKKAERARLERGDGVERAAFRKLAAENEMMTLGREWMILKLAEGLLSTAMEHHRAQTSDPVMARAGAILKRLTYGSFATLAQVFDDDDRAHLVACRPDGSQVPVTAMSEGSRDQLYLALRLAFLADYSARAEAAPFIGDDLFQTFDDTRTAAGIDALAELSQTVQPILFTHHLSVVDIARKTLGEGLDLLEF
ncbi:AAA family ATPase [Stappia sp.]|uniref:ATP-binding protein n=1 Tax=Stappia sp. TaxID=1870903 RepID=UPI003C7B20AC